MRPICFLQTADINKEIIKSNGFVLVYKPTDVDSFTSLNVVRNTILRLRAPLKENFIPFILVQTFADVEDKKVSASEGKEMATTLECPFFEVVANEPNNPNIQEAFTEIIRQVYLLYKAKKGKNINSRKFKEISRKYRNCSYAYGKRS